MEINRPEVVAEVGALFELYEASLRSADAAALDRLFWNHDATVRYGAGEILRGHPAIQAFNHRRRPVPERRLTGTVITTFGEHFATVSTLFQDRPDGKVGRQMQSWARMPDGWHVVAAHVSLVADEAGTAGG